MSDNDELRARLNGWRIMPFTGSFKRHKERWEIYDPAGSGGAVCEDDVKDWSVRNLLDALAALAPASGGDAEVARLRQALEDVADPIGYLRRDAEAKGERLGGMAYSIANDLHFVQQIASRALAPASGGDAEVARLRQALEDVADPIGYLRRDAEAKGERLGGMAYSIANDLHFVQQIASRALAPASGGDTPQAAGVSVDAVMDRLFGKGGAAYAYDPMAPVISFAEVRQALTHALTAAGSAPESDLLALQRFAVGILGDDEIGSLDGGDIQDTAEACGLLVPTEVSASCGEGCVCASYGDFPMTCYRRSPILSRAYKADHENSAPTPPAAPQEDTNDGR